MSPDFLVFGVLILLISAVVHEVAHGYAAQAFGDPTARLAGRLTLNPIPHIDMFGSVLLPALLVLSNSPLLFGYAKPVPYNPYNLKSRFGLSLRGAEAFVAASGALSNFALALIFGLTLRFLGDAIPPSLNEIFGYTVIINLMLGVFNLVPIPPLDGAKVLSNLLPGTLAHGYRAFEMRLQSLGFFSGFFIVIVLFYILSPFFSAFLRSLYSLIVG